MFLLGMINMFIIFQVQSQNERNLGKIHFNGSPDIILSATESNGAFTYVLENESEKSELFTFTLYDNSYENFRTAVKQKLIDVQSVAEPTPEILNRYFFYFQNQTHFQVLEKPGGLAMKMDFNDTLVVYGFKYANLSHVKKKDVANFLASLEYQNFDPANFDENPWDPAVYSNFIFLKGIKAGVNEKELTFKAFEYKLSEIEKFKPHSLRWSELYKEIQYRYYLFTIRGIEEKVETIRKGGKSISEKKLDISILKKEVDGLVLKETMLIDTIAILANSVRALEIEKVLYSKENTSIKIWTLPEGFSLADTIDQKEYIQKFSNILTRANQIDSSVHVNPIPNLDGNLSKSDLESKYGENLRILESAQASLDRFNAIDPKIRELKDIMARMDVILESSQFRINEIRDSLKSENENLKNLEEKIQDSIKVQIEALKKSNKFNFVPTTIQIEINRGYLENIVIEGDAFTYVEPAIASFADGVSFSKTKIKFVNDYPLGISSKLDIEKLGEIKIYSRNGDGQINFEMRLGNLISNIVEILALDRTDYSPKDSAYTIKMKESSSIDFPKPNSKEILQMKVFSDFIGLNEENPNGLIQLEIDKEIPLVTKRIAQPYVWRPFRWAINKYGNIGYFNFFKPKFVLSKVEDNNRYLHPKEFIEYDEAGKPIPPGNLGVTTLDLKLYERFVIGTELNLLLYNIPYGKSTFLINAGMHFGRTDFVSYDTIPEITIKPREYTNTYQPSIEGLWRISGDERYGFEFAYGVNWVISDQQNFTQRSNTFGIDNFKDFKDLDKQYAIQRVTLLAYLNVNQNREGRLFFRYRSNSQWRFFKNNYSQLQIGYTTSLTKRVD
ncbi:hypothetical protein A8938_1018 [Algoriphagus zhangzhouensis]|uniref:Uncharacterized protein n=2 Tax=Algoriphagus zhangzhouensis TaxID=1073327 RepID=A0A1M7Z7E7_9BACT|nr:hypothetical protein A8938_1018 [Algoriphagus zhangzhouensis]SHO60774.1 hypothetical protein SAMN04488108_1018 [Algoriphagus zhangzhouensis]